MLKTLIEEYRYYFRIKPEVTNRVVAIRIIIFLAVAGCTLSGTSCEYGRVPIGKGTKFGKQYNVIRLKYGSPIIHDYMELKSSDEGFERWHIPSEIHDTITNGFHAGKGFYIHQDSVLQEDDIFRKRIDDSTFAFIGILTYGNLTKNEITSIYLDSIDSRELKLKVMEYLSANNIHRAFIRKNLTITQADSILQVWGTSRFK